MAPVFEDLLTDGIDADEPHASEIFALSYRMMSAAVDHAALKDDEIETAALRCIELARQEWHEVTE